MVGRKVRKLVSGKPHFESFLAFFGAVIFARRAAAHTLLQLLIIELALSFSFFEVFFLFFIFICLVVGGILLLKVPSLVSIIAHVSE